MSNPARSSTRRRSLSLRVQLAFLTLGLTAIILTGGVSYWIARGALETAAYERLTAIRETKKRQLEAYLSDSLAIVAALGRDESAVDGLLGFRRRHGRRKAADYRAVLDLHDTGLAGVAQASGLRGSAADRSRTAWSCTPPTAGRELGAELNDDALAESLLARGRSPRCSRTLRRRTWPTMRSISTASNWRRSPWRPSSIRAEPIGAHRCAAVDSPDRRGDDRRRPAGATRGLGDSGETYLVGADRLMRSDSRFLVEAPGSYYAHLEELGYPAERIEQIRCRGTTVLMQPVETEAVARALAGETATSRIRSTTAAYRC